MESGLRAVVMEPAAWLAAGQQGGSGPVAARIALVAVAVLAVAAFAVLQVKAPSARLRPPRRRRRYDPADWRALPRPYLPEAGDGEAPAAPYPRDGLSGAPSRMPR